MSAHGPDVLDPAFEAGSFRDPDGRVVIADGTVYRALSPVGLEDWRALADSSLLEKLLTEGKVVGTEEISDDGVSASVEAALGDRPAALLRHERIPVISYPYEWSFSMLRDAALLQLELLERSLDEGLILKDSSSYNVQWLGTKPTFIDVSSFERMREGEPWVGYRQFCMLFLYPLMLQAYRDIDFHPLLRGSIDGIAPAQAKAMLGGRARFRKGVLSHVRLHARLEAGSNERSGDDVKKELKKAQFKTELIRANLKKLRKLIEGLRWKSGETAWTAYRDTNTYTDSDDQHKRDFVRATVAASRRGLAWDLGCNDGAYSQIATENTDYVVATDYDHATVDALYRELLANGNEKILPLVENLTDPSPGLGWRGLERKTIADRGRPDLILALALVHHVSITGNVPLREVLDWLASLGAQLVIEFPTREDPMVKRLLSAKRDGLHPDYELAEFERLLGERFEVGRREQLPSGTRVLFDATPLRT